LQPNKPNSKHQSVDEETLSIGEREKDESAKVEANDFESITPAPRKKPKPTLLSLD
jgi:hypothetical protein